MRDTVIRVGLVVLGVPAAFIGLWAAFAPRSFYDDFPGLGRVWVAADGPYNEHLVRDVGELNLALAIATLAAAASLARPLVRAVLVAWVVSGGLHLLYHGRHLEPYDAGDQIGLVASLALAPVLAVVLLVLDAAKMPGSPTSRSSGSSTSGSTVGTGIG